MPPHYLFKGAMDDRRKSNRVPVALEAMYTVEENRWGHCRIKDISPAGTRLELHSTEKLKAGTNIGLEIFIPRRKEPVKAVVILVWVKPLKGGTKFNFAVGSLMTTITPEDKKLLLDYASPQ